MATTAAVSPDEAETMAAKTRKNGTASSGGNGPGAAAPGAAPGDTFGRRLATLRKAAGYSQRAFAEEIGISYRMVAYYEAQTRRPPAQLLPVLAKALHLTTDQLLGLETVPKRQPPLNQRLLRKMKLIEALPPRDQRPLLRTIDAYLKGAEKA